MDTAYMTELLLSSLIFAPGLVLLGVALFIGMLIGFEKLGVLDRFIRPRAQGAGVDLPEAAAGNPPAGRIVAELKGSAAETERKRSNS